MSRNHRRQIIFLISSLLLYLEIFSSTNEVDQNLRFRFLLNRTDYNLNQSESFKSFRIDFLGLDPTQTYCECDSIANECDVDCCCDSDCNQTEKFLSFSRCLRSSSRSPSSLMISSSNKFASRYLDEINHLVDHYDDDHSSNGCFQTNSFNKLARSSSSSPIFCLVRDNTESKQTFIKRPIIKNPKQLDEIVGSKHQFSWDQSMLVGKKFKSNLVTQIDPINQDDISIDSNSLSRKENFFLISNKKNANEFLRISRLQYQSGSPMKWFQLYSDGRDDYGGNVSKKYIRLKSIKWTLPTSSKLYSNFYGLCGGWKEVQYLYDFYSICRLRFDKKRSFEENCRIEKRLDWRTYIKEEWLFLYKNLENIDSEKFTATISNVELFRIEFINGSLQNKSTYYDVRLRQCRNVVEQIDVTIWHEGIKGPRKITIAVKQIDLPEESENFQQILNVTFVWFDKNLFASSSTSTKNSTSLIEKISKLTKIDRSTRIGYFFGDQMNFWRKPLRSATNDNNDVDGNKTETTPSSSFTRLNQLNVFTSDSDGICQKPSASSSFKFNQIKNQFIRFGINQFQFCRIDSNEVKRLSGLDSQTLCDQFQQLINQYLIFSDQIYFNLSDSKQNFSLFGESMRLIPIDSGGQSYYTNQKRLMNELVEIFDRTNEEIDQKNDQSILASQSKCLNLFNGLNLHFYFIRIDLDHFKIIGADYSKTIGQISPTFDCERKSVQNSRLFSLAETNQSVANKSIESEEKICSFRETDLNGLYLSRSIDFIDLSSPFIPEYAPAPSIKIELPSDFFYPFLTTAPITTTTSSSFQSNTCNSLAMWDFLSTIGLSHSNFIKINSKLLLIIQFVLVYVFIHSTVFSITNQAFI